MNWTPITQALPPEGKVVETKIADPDCNVQDLKRQDKRWYFPDGSGYVYYTPTDWRYKTITGPTIDTDHPDGEAIREVLRKHGFGKPVGQK